MANGLHGRRGHRVIKIVFNSEKGNVLTQLPNTEDDTAKGERIWPNTNVLEGFVNLVYIQ